MCVYGERGRGVEARSQHDSVFVKEKEKKERHAMKGSADIQRFHNESEGRRVNSRKHCQTAEEKAW